MFYLATNKGFYAGFSFACAAGSTYTQDIRSAAAARKQSDCEFRGKVLVDSGEIQYYAVVTSIIPTQD